MPDLDPPGRPDQPFEKPPDTPVHPERPELIDHTDEPLDIAHLAAEAASHVSFSSLEKHISDSSNRSVVDSTSKARGAPTTSKDKKSLPPAPPPDPTKNLIDVVVGTAMVKVMNKVLSDEKQRSDEFLVTSVVREVTDNAIRRSRLLLQEQAVLSGAADKSLAPPPSEEEVRKIVAEAVKRTVARLQALESQRVEEESENASIAEILKNLPVAVPNTTEEELKNRDFRKMEGRVDLHHVHNNILGRYDVAGAGSLEDAFPSKEAEREANFRKRGEPRSPQNYLKRGEGLNSGAKYYPKIHYPKTRAARPKTSHGHPFLSRRKKLWLAPQITGAQPGVAWHQSLARVPPKITAKKLARAASPPSRKGAPGDRPHHRSLSPPHLAPPDMDLFPFGSCDLRCELSGRWMVPFGSENVHGSLKRLPGGAVWSLEETQSLFPLRESERSCTIRCLRPRGVEDAPDYTHEDPDADKFYLYSEGSVLRLASRASVFVFEGFADGVEEGREIGK